MYNHLTSLVYSSEWTTIFRNQWILSPEYAPDDVKVNEGDLSPLDEELIKLFWQLPDTQKHVAFEYVKQQLDITDKARGRE